MELSSKAIETAFKEAGLLIKGHGNEIAELRECCKVLQSQLRQVAQWRTAGLDAQGKDYPGFWPSDEMAEQFGLLVCKCIGREFRNKDMGTLVGSEGGFVVPEDLAAWIIQKLQTYGKYRKNVLTVKVGARQWVPKVSTDLTVYAPGESKTITPSDIAFSQVKMEPIKMACLAVVNSELEEDAIVGLGEIIGISVTRSIAKKEDEIGFMGDGSATYFGRTGIIGALLAVDATITNIAGIKVGSGNAYSELTLQDFEDTVALLEPSADEGAKWYCHKRFFHGVMRKLALAAGVADLWGILSPQKTRYFLGYEVEFVHAMPYAAANNQLCAVLADLKQGAYLGERRTLEIARSNDFYFATDQIGFRATERVDFNAHGVGNTTAPESIVALAMAGS
jgi:HK97 family phage major capsid protein